MKSRVLAELALKKSRSPFGRIVVLTGARQTGKTTLVQKTFPEFEYISLEDPITVGSYKNLSSQQWNTRFPRAILDEIQKEPGLVESIKAVYDQYEKPQYILLGSAQIMLMKKVKESLAGRCQILELYPLTLPELMTRQWEDEVALSFFQKILRGGKPDNIPFLLDKDHSAKSEAFESYLKFGGYPAISNLNIDTSDKLDWLRNYVKTYLERDIRDLAEIRNLEPFVKVQKIMALYTGRLINYSQIAVEAGVSPKTVQRFLEYLSISYQTIVVQPWSRNLKKRLVKSPKVHFLDVGVLRTILQKRDRLTGQEYESAIVAEIYKQMKTIETEASFYHLRTSDGREVDLLIELENGYLVIEIKQSETVRQLDARHIKGLEYILDKPVLHKFLISNDSNTRVMDDGVYAIPAAQFLT